MDSKYPATASYNNDPMHEVTESHRLNRSFRSMLLNDGPTQNYDVTNPQQSHNMNVANNAATGFDQAAANQVSLLHFLYSFNYIFKI